MWAEFPAAPAPPASGDGSDYSSASSSTIRPPASGDDLNIRPTSLGSYVFSASARNLGSRCGCLKRVSSPDRPVDQQPQHSDEKPRSSRAPMTIAESQTPVPWFIRTLLLPHALCETTRTSAETKAHTPEFGHRRQKAHNRFISKNNQDLGGRVEFTCS